MNARIFLCILLSTFVLSVESAFSGEIAPISLKPYATNAPFDVVKADWLLPRGRHVFDGVPWQIDGTVLLYGDFYVQREKRAPELITNIPVSKTFDVLHLLAAAQAYDHDGTAIARVLLNYSDGTRSILDVVYGDHVRYFQGPWHKPGDPLKNTNVHEAWHAQCDDTAYNGNYLRLFHVPLANPFPAKEVRTVSLKSTKQKAALMIAAMSVGPSDAAPLPNDFIGNAPYPDLRTRSGKPCTAEGTVCDSNGKPISDAVVKAVLARKYPDFSAAETGVGTQTKTDANGHFALPGLADDCAYRFLISADNFVAFLYRGVDPISDPIAVRLSRTNSVVGKYAARARITDPSGRPVAFAQVDREGVGIDNSTSWGGPSNLPGTTMTDKNGEVVFSQNAPFSRVQIKVVAPNFAPLHQWIPVTNAITTLQMTIGSTIRGRVLDRNSKPLPNVKLVISGADRAAEVYAGEYTAFANADGIFEFKHVIPGTNWNIYGPINALKNFGALPPRAVTSFGDGLTNDIGDLQLFSPRRIAGTVKTRHGEALPADLRLYLGLGNTSDYQFASVDHEGHFAFEGLYPGQVSISLYDRKNWKLSSVNRSLSFYNASELTGMLETTKDDILVMIEKGSVESGFNSFNGSLPPGDNPAFKPIAGTENIEGAIVLSGSVIDDQTGQAIAKCKIIPGYKPARSAWGVRTAQPQKNLVQKLLSPLASKQNAQNFPWESPCWIPARMEETTDGTFSIAFIPLQSTPMLRVEAPGYQPFITEPIPTSTNGLVIRLSRGEGPTGVVLLPDGNPAENASVRYAVAREQFGLKERDFMVYGREKELFKTAADGAFKFALLPGDGKVFAAHPSGYGEELVRGKDEKLKIRLKPWATLIGTLMNSNGTAATNIELGLQLYDGTSFNMNLPVVNFSGRATTDDKGVFVFSNVPPRRVHVSRLVPITIGRTSQRAMSYREQTWLDVEPGTNDLGKITIDSPPAQPVVEQIKRRLGL